MHPARIAELLQPFLSSLSNPCHSEPAKAGEEPAVLSPSQLQYISTYIDILLRWNARINRTAIRDPEGIVTRHFGESLFAARHLFPLYPVSSSVPSVFPVLKDLDSTNDQRPTTSDRVADVGSGAGFPGIPIKLWAPHIALTLIESNQKKATFLREVARALTLTDIDIFPGRAQTLAEGLAANPAVPPPAEDPRTNPPRTFDLVTLRAVERFHDVLPIAARLVANGGRLALLIGTSQIHLARSRLPTFAWQQPLPIPGSRSRVLFVGLFPG
jgi:16S rRNA (guanine527-N7)-methyltransferase